MKYFKLLFIACLTLIVSACASATGPAFSNGPQLTQRQTGIYFYRTPTTLDARGNIFYIYLDGQKVGDLRNAGYLYTTTTPGAHTLKVDDGIPLDNTGTEISMNINPGKIVFYKVHIHWDGWVRSIRFKQIRRDTAVQAMQSLHYSNN